MRGHHHLTDRQWISYMGERNERAARIAKIRQHQNIGEFLRSAPKPEGPPNLVIPQPRQETRVGRSLRYAAALAFAALELVLVAAVFRYVVMA
jgi:chorismate mutase